MLDSLITIPVSCSRAFMIHLFVCFKVGLPSESPLLVRVWSLCCIPSKFSDIMVLPWTMTMLTRSNIHDNFDIFILSIQKSSVESTWSECGDECEKLGYFGLLYEMLFSWFLNWFVAPEISSVVNVFSLKVFSTCLVRTFLSLVRTKYWLLSNASWQNCCFHNLLNWNLPGMGQLCFLNGLIGAPCVLFFVESYYGHGGMK